MSHFHKVSFRLLLILGIVVAPLHAFGTQIWLCGVDPIKRAQVAEPRIPTILKCSNPTHRGRTPHRECKYLRFMPRLLREQVTLCSVIFFRNVRSRHIALALEAGLLSGSRACGQGVEGYNAPGTIVRIFKRIRQLGGDLRYVAMDEPLWFGHEYNGPHACHTSLPELAHNAALTIATIGQFFPAVQVGDIEPVGNRQPANWISQVMAWTSAYREATGERLYFLDADVVWTGQWRQQLRFLADHLRLSGIRFGIIYNGNTDDSTGLDWTKHAEHRFVQVESDPSLIPDQAILQSWMGEPQHMLPELQPGTMTWLVDRYLALQTDLNLRRQGGRLIGRLTDRAGRAIANAPVALMAVRNSRRGALTLYGASGRVPESAVNALFGLRINAECNCTPGSANMTIGVLSYSDNRTGQRIQRRFQSGALSSQRDAPTRFQVLPGQSVNKNTISFPVISGDRFALEVPMNIITPSSGTAYVALIFLNTQGREVLRVHLELRLGTVKIGQASTEQEWSVFLHRRLEASTVV